MTFKRQKLANLGENRATRYLINHGYKIIGRNVHNKIGEIDIIAKKGVEWVFVEVKTKSSTEQGSPEEMVHTRKKHKLIDVIKLYQQEKDIYNQPSRIDVIAIIWRDNRLVSLNHLENAVEIG